jgi:hypothetical protein
MISTPITVAIINLPSQFDEALRIPRSMGPTYLAGGNRVRAGTKGPQEGVAELMPYHKGADLASQPQRGGELKRLTIVKAANRYLVPAVAFC